jgi:hypothetical protein
LAGGEVPKLYPAVVGHSYQAAIVASEYQARLWVAVHNGPVPCGLDCLGMQIPNIDRSVRTPLCKQAAIVI